MNTNGHESFCFIRVDERPFAVLLCRVKRATRFDDFFNSRFSSTQPSKSQTNGKVGNAPRGERPVDGFSEFMRDSFLRSVEKVFIE